MNGAINDQNLGVRQFAGMGSLPHASAAHAVNSPIPHTEKGTPWKST
ncbi:hypothetical protein ABIE00_000211 [Arthrobacter sp. OAP107]